MQIRYHLDPNYPYLLFEKSSFRKRSKYLATSILTRTGITCDKILFQKSFEFDMPSEKRTTRYKQIIIHYQITNEGKQRNKSEFVTKFVGLIITVTPK